MCVLNYAILYHIGINNYFDTKVHEIYQLHTFRILKTACIKFFFVIQNKSITFAP